MKCDWSEKKSSVNLSVTNIIIIITIIIILVITSVHGT